MKKFSIIFGLLFACSLHAYADCNDDILQMADQISQFKSITTSDGRYRFTGIGSYLPPMQDDFCIASATPFIGMVCNGNDCSAYGENCSEIRWRMGSWGDTFTCAN